MKPHFPCFISGRLGAVLLSSACGVFLMAGKAKGIEFVTANGIEFKTENTIVSHFSNAGQHNIDEVVATNTLLIDDGSVVPSSHLIGSTQGANPHLLTGGTAGQLDDFVLPADDLSGGQNKIWEITLDYTDIGGLTAVESLTLNLGIANNHGNWWGTDQTFPNNMHLEAAVKDVDTGTTLGNLYGSVWDTAPYTGFGAELRARNLDDQSAEVTHIDLKGAQHIQITIQGKFDGTGGSSKFFLGFGDITLSGNTTSLGYIWDGKEGENQWGDHVWDSETEKDRAFGTGGPAVFNGGGTPEVNIVSPTTAGHVYVEPQGEFTSCEYTFNLDADTEDAPSLSSQIFTIKEDGRINLSNGQGETGTMHTQVMDGTGTLGKVGEGTSILVIDGNSIVDDGKTYEYNFTGSVDVEEGLLDIQSQVDLSLQDVTLGSQLHVGTEEGYKNVTVNGTLTAQNVSAGLNANLVMADGSTLDVSATGGTGGLLSDGTVTFNLGNIILSEDDMEMISALEFHGMYDLFHGVESFTVGSDTIEPGTWVKASDVFSNELFKGDKEYYLFYSGNSEGGQGGNVGTIYLMQIPEPATGTLSLLALAGLAARRRRKN